MCVVLKLPVSSCALSFLPVFSCAALGEALSLSCRCSAAQRSARRSPFPVSYCARALLPAGGVQLRGTGRGVFLPAGFPAARRALLPAGVQRAALDEALSLLPEFSCRRRWAMRSPSFWCSAAQRWAGRSPSCWCSAARRWTTRSLCQHQNPPLFTITLLCV